jgi:hypothetical protein
MMTEYRGKGAAHPASSFRECINNEFFILFSPSPHGSVHGNEKADIVVDVLPVTWFLVKGNAA